MFWLGINFYDPIKRESGYETAHDATKIQKKEYFDRNISEISIDIAYLALGILQVGHISIGAYDIYSLVFFVVVFFTLIFDDNFFIFNVSKM